MNRDESEVLIVGAGPVGLTLAIALADQKLRVTLIDRAEGFSSESKAITIQPRVLEMFRLLGVASRLEAAGVAARTMTMHVGRTLKTTLRYDRLPTAFPHYLHLHQGETERLLCAALAERDVTVTRGTTLDDFTATEAGVTARLVGADGTVRKHRARFLVGCDGGHSRVRQRLGVVLTGERHDNEWIMADVRIPDLPLARDVRHGYILEDYPFVVLPLAGDYCRLISARSARASRGGAAPTLAEFHEIIGRLGFAGWRLEDPLWLTCYRPSQFIASRFSKGPVFLAGDAAHVNTPIAAQGLNTGVMDAMNLAWKLGWAQRHRAGPGLLDSYHEERRPAVLNMFRANDRLTTLVFGKNRLLRSLLRRSLALLELPTQNLRNVAQSSQLAVNYRESPIVQSAYDSGGDRRAARSFAADAPRPGDRVPHAVLVGANGVCRDLQDVLRPWRHTLLLFGGPAGREWLEATRARAEARLGSWLDVHCIQHPADPGAIGDEGWWCDSQATLHRAFGVRGAAGVLTRPDAFVAARFTAEDPDAAERYGRALRFHIGGPLQR